MFEEKLHKAVEGGIDGVAPKVTSLRAKLKKQRKLSQRSRKTFASIG